jgi:hypothetical protein
MITIKNSANVPIATPKPAITVPGRSSNITIPASKPITVIAPAIAMLFGTPTCFTESAKELNALLLRSFDAALATNTVMNRIRITSKTVTAYCPALSSYGAGQQTYDSCEQLQSQL